jgi:hypothetical protein
LAERRFEVKRAVEITALQSCPHFQQLFAVAVGRVDLASTSACP